MDRLSEIKTKYFLKQKAIVVESSCEMLLTNNTMSQIGVMSIAASNLAMLMVEMKNEIEEYRVELKNKQNDSK